MDTIAAIATPPGRGGIGIIRLSGPLAYQIGLKLTCRSQLKPRLAYYGAFHDVSGELIDEGITLYFKAPHSFTGEDVVELQGHGSPVILDELLQQCIHHGARLAKPGEFSERAFINGKMDLTQAEAIADLIQASSLTAAKMAVRSLQGDFSKQIQALNEQLIQLRLYAEAAIDFPDEEIDFLSDGKIAAKLQTLLQDLNQILDRASQGVMLREGLSVVIAGRPNAGKSTLINRLAGREVAIVTDVAGTTRDVMREHILLDDIPIHIMDTAGLRESDDIVEKEGIQRAWQALSQADCVLLVIDATEIEPDIELSHAIAERLPEHVPIIRVLNKVDQLKSLETDTRHPERSKGSPDFQKMCRDARYDVGHWDREPLPSMTIYISAKSGEGLHHLIANIKKVVGYQPVEGQFLARRRHLQALNEAKRLLLSGQDQLTIHRALALLAEDLRLAHQSLCEITGEFTSDDLLGRIFSSFCIGK